MNTRVQYWVKPVGDKKSYYDHVFEDVELPTKQDAEDYMDFGREGNHLIIHAQELSPYGILENWRVTKVMVFSDSELHLLDDLREKEKLLKLRRKEVREIKKDTKKKVEELKKKREELDKSIESEKVRLGWQSLTTEELEWYFNRERDKSSCIFALNKPSAAQIKALYQEDNSTIVEDKFKDFPNLRITNGWLDPYGEYYPVLGFAKHNDWAFNYLEEKNHDWDEKWVRGMESAYEVLEKRGWMRIMDWGNGTELSFGYQKEPTHPVGEKGEQNCSPFVF